MVFGAKAAVWGYNRVGDAVIFLVRVLFLMMSFHYVDDYGGVEPDESADSAFDTFAQFSAIIGFQTKTSKAQPPNKSHIMLGIDVTIDSDYFTTRVTDLRKQKMKDEISGYIQS